MPEMLPGVWALSPLGGLIGILVLAYWLLVTGRLIPRSSHERELATSNHRADEWKETAQHANILNREQSAQIATFAEAMKTPAEFFRTVQGGDGHEKANTRATDRP